MKDENSGKGHSSFDRRTFVKRVGYVGAGAAALTFLGGASANFGAQPRVAPLSGILPWGDRREKEDTAQEVFTAALIAEDLATTMYYNALVGGVIQDPNLAGPGGTATMVTSGGSLANVGYLRGALSEEIVHANLLRELIGGKAASGDPVQTFYFPTGTFDTLAAFFPVLLSLETAFIGAYLTAVQEFAAMAARVGDESYGIQHDPSGKPYTREDLVYYAKVAASIMGVESEHRTLARAIPSGQTFDGVSIIPADNLNFEQTDGLKTVYNGPNSAVVALTPFLAAGSGLTGFSFATALADSSKVTLPTMGGLPAR